MWSHGSFYWNELMAHDVERAKILLQRDHRLDFRSDADAQRYLLGRQDGDKPVGGIFPMTGPEFSGMQEGWASYLAVDDVDARPRRRLPPAPRRCASPSMFPASAASPTSRSGRGP